MQGNEANIRANGAAAQETRRQFVARVLDSSDVTRVLAIAPTASAIAPMLAQRVPCVLRLVAPTAARPASHGADPMRHAVRGDVAALPLATSSVDAIVCSDLLHHFVAPLPPLREFRRVCRPGGLIALGAQVSAEDPQQAAEQNAIARMRDPAHIWFYPPSELAAILRASGLRIRSVETTTTRRELEEWLAEASLAAEQAASIRARFVAAMADDRAGLAPAWAAGRVVFTQQFAWIIAEAPATEGAAAG